MIDKIFCETCGRDCSTGRFCSYCGTQIFLPLDSPNIKNEQFIDIFNSAYNLLADKRDPNRRKYLAEDIENYITKRAHKFYADFWQHTVSRRTMFKGLGEAFNQDIEPNIQQLALFSSSTTLAGYSFRLSEELYSGKDITSSIKYIDDIINNYIEKYAEEGEVESSSKIELLCYGLCYDLNYSIFYLMDKTDIENYIDSISNQNFLKGIQIRKDYLEKLYKSSQIADKFIEDKKDELYMEIYSDFIYGYSLNISSKLIQKYYSNSLA